MRNVPYSEQDDALLVSHLHENPFPAKEMAAQLGRTVWSIKGRAGRIREGLRNNGAVPKSRTSQINPARRNGVAGPQDVPGMRNCLRCTHEFNSWDIKRNRLCPACTVSRDMNEIFTIHTAHVNA